MSPIQSDANVSFQTFQMSATLRGSDLGCSQYLFVMLHLQSLQFTSLCTFSLTLILCLMKLNHKHTKANIKEQLS